MTAPSPLALSLAHLREEISKTETHLATLGLGRPHEATASTTPTPHKENAR